MAPGDPKRCSQCGYDLTGLPGVGKCPECGEPFNMFTGEGVKSPSTAASDTERALRRIRALTLIGVAVFFVLCSGLIQGFVPRGHALAVGCVVAVIPLLWAITTYMEDKN